MNFERIGYYYDLLSVLTKKQLKVRYKNSVLGYFWSVANPLLYATIFYFVFKVIMRFQIKDYTLFLISALFPWQWINNSVISSADVFLGNVSLIKKVVFPRLFLPLVQVLNDAIHFLISVPIILIFVLVYGKLPSPAWFIYISLMLVPTFFSIYGIALIVSSVNVFLRDFQYIVNLLMTVLFYLTPIFYSLELVPQKYRFLIFANPFTSLIENWRTVFMENTILWNRYCLSLVYSVLILAVGLLVYRKLEKRFAEMV